MPFYPGPGLGGHCIPVDPLYLSWKLKTLKYEARFITLADEINSHMPDFVVDKVQSALNDDERALKGARVLVLGVAYKKNIDDVRESPALDVMHLLQQKGAHVTYHDTHVPVMRLGAHTLESQALTRLADFECVLILTDHSDVDYARVLRESRLVVDTRNATRAFRSDAKARVVGL
jgi:UDP-N-acetyl-D-glucosamine dehydrogenase